MFSKKTALPFILTATAWFALGVIVLAWSGSESARAMAQFVGLVALCLLDLLALAKAVEWMLRIHSIAPEKRGAALVQTFFWGALKLACLGIFILVLSKGVHFVASSLILGLGTMIVVPLVGGYFWSRPLAER